MITQNDKLEIFENFRTDHRLPKFKKKRDVYRSTIEAKKAQFESDEDDMSENDGEVDEGFSNASRFVVHGSVGAITLEGVDIKSGQGIIIRNNKTGFWRWLRNSILGALKTYFAWFIPKPKPEPELTISIEDFFCSIKNSSKELEVVRGRAEGYDKAMLQAKNSGQVALLEKLKGGLESYRNETQLLAIESRRYLLEEDIVKFVKLAKKGLRLDWIANFTRMIPNNLVELKIKMDELGVFDNYVILHYDPDKKSWAETQEEIRRRKDPILFGVMRGSRKLYFVGDWVDEMCDLTLEQIVDVLGAGAVREIVTES